jgi:hypothetical protein
MAKKNSTFTIESTKTKNGNVRIVNPDYIAGVEGQKPYAYVDGTNFKATSEPDNKGTVKGTIELSGNVTVTQYGDGNTTSTKEIAAADIAAAHTPENIAKIQEEQAARKEQAKADKAAKKEHDAKLAKFRQDDAIVGRPTTFPVDAKDMAKESNGDFRKVNIFLPAEATGYRKGYVMLSNNQIYNVAPAGEKPQYVASFGAAKNESGDYKVSAYATDGMGKPVKTSVSMKDIVNETRNNRGWEKNIVAGLDKRAQELGEPATLAERESNRAAARAAAAERKAAAAAEKAAAADEKTITDMPNVEQPAGPEAEVQADMPDME